jgi:hypothetical protein
MVPAEAHAQGASRGSAIQRSSAHGLGRLERSKLSTPNPTSPYTTNKRAKLQVIWFCVVEADVLHVPMASPVPVAIPSAKPRKAIASEEEDVSIKVKLKYNYIPSTLSTQKPTNLL